MSGNEVEVEKKTDDFSLFFEIDALQSTIRIATLLAFSLTSRLLYLSLPLHQSTQINILRAPASA